MKAHNKLPDWFKSLGYDGEIPNSFKIICNASTCALWEQLIQNVKPKQEVEMCRRNIIINKLGMGIEYQDGSTCPIKEIAIYKKLGELKTEKVISENLLKDQDILIDGLLKDNKIKYVEINSIKENIQDLKERTFLLRRKITLTETKIENTEELIGLARNLTPVETETNPNSKDIEVLLRKCSEKLEKLIQNAPSSNNNKINGFSYNSCFSKQKKRRNCFSTVKKKPDPNIDAGSVKSSRSSVCLFNDNRYQQVQERVPQIANQECMQTINTFSHDLEQVKETKLGRESLGLLPNDYLDFDADDELLSTDNLNGNRKLLEIESDVFKDQFIYPTPVKYGSGSYLNHNVSYENCSGRSSYYDKITLNEDFTDVIKSMLYSYNRQLIWNSLRSFREKLLLNARKSILGSNHGSGETQEINNGDITRLNYIHVKIELQSMKCQKVASRLNEAIGKLLPRTQAILKSYGLNKEDRIDILNLQIQNIGLDAGINYLKKEVNSTKYAVSNNDFEMLNSKISQSKSSLISVINNIQENVEKIYEYVQKCNKVRDDAVMCVRKLNQFVCDVSWAAPLTERLHCHEQKVFQSFPLHYNQRFTFTESDLRPRDIISNVVKFDQSISSDSTYMMTVLLDKPYSPPEIILRSAVIKNNKLKTLREFRNPLIVADYKTYKLEELIAQENYIESAHENLSKVIHSTTTNNILESPFKTKKNLEFWLEMPFRRYISIDRLVDSKPYNEYEKIYNYLYKNLK